jgi:hypothetical protein
MKLVELTNVSRKHNVLHYRRTFSATAVVQNGTASSEEHLVRFIVEHAPLGPTMITVELAPDDTALDGELVQAIRGHVADLDAAGLLP